MVAVLAALSIQCAYYLTRIRLQSWVRPRQVFAGMRDALVMAFSTASSTATMPVTYDRLRSRIGLREQSASLGALVGANFNNDGTALYEAMAALFIAQMLGVELGFGQQLMVVLTSVIASVGAAGIPEAGPRDDDPGVYRGQATDRVHCALAHRRLASGPLPHDDQRSG